MKKVLICVWGPEQGCISREVQLAEKLVKTGDFIIAFYCHKNHIQYIQNILGLDTAIFTYEKTLGITYCQRFDLLPLQTLLTSTKFFSTGLFSEYLKFKEIVKNFRPNFIINDFLPHVSFYTKILGIPCIGIQNYVCPKISDNRSLMDFLFWLGFHSSYGLHSHNLVETFFPEILPQKEKITWTTPVAREVDRSRKSVNNELGIRNKEKLVLLALGGASVNLAYLKEIHDYATEYPYTKILLLPRNDREAMDFPVNYPNFVHTGRVVHDTHNYVGNSDIVISKCGFRTVAETFKNGAAFLPFHTPNHPEIYLTETFLWENRLIETSILKTDSAKQVWEKIVVTSESPGKKELPLISYRGELEMLDFLKQCPEIIAKKTCQE